MTRGGGAAHFPGPAGDSFKRRAACAVARALAEPGPGLRFYLGTLPELLRGGQVRRARGASAWGVLLASGAGGGGEDPSGAPCLPVSLRKLAGAADAAAPALRPRVLSRRLPRTSLHASLRPLPRDLRVLGPRLQARP